MGSVLVVHGLSYLQRHVESSGIKGIEPVYTTLTGGFLSTATREVPRRSLDSPVTLISPLAVIPFLLD